MRTARNENYSNYNKSSANRLDIDTERSSKLEDKAEGITWNASQTEKRNGKEAD